MVPHTQPFGEQGIAELSHLLLIKMKGDQCPPPLQHVFESNHLSLTIKPLHFDDVERLVQNDFSALP